MTGKSFYLDTCFLVSLAFGDGGFPALEIWLEQAQSSSLWISQLVILELSDVLARSAGVIVPQVRLLACT